MAQNSTSLPDEMLIEIIHYCSSADLVQVHATSKQFYEVLGNSTLWERAREAHPSNIPPPPSHDDLTTINVSEQAYAHLIWGGGECLVCGEWTMKPPVDFYLCLRACSVYHECLIINGYGTVTVPESVWQTSPVNLFPNNPISRRYSCHDIQRAEEEMQQATLVSNGPEILPEVWEIRKAARPHLIKHASKLEEWVINFTSEFHERLLDWTSSDGIDGELALRIDSTMGALLYSWTIDYTSPASQLAAWTTFSKDFAGKYDLFRNDKLLWKLLNYHKSTVKEDVDQMTWRTVFIKNSIVCSSCPICEQLHEFCDIHKCTEAFDTVTDIIMPSLSIINNLHTMKRLNDHYHSRLQITG